MNDRVDRYFWDPDDVVFSTKTADAVREHGSVTFMPIETVEVKTVHAEALRELKAWRKFIKNDSAAKREFKTYMVRDDIADTLTQALNAAGGDAEAIDRAFTEAERESAIKTNAVVQSNFELEIKSLIDRGRRGDLQSRDVTTRVKQAIREYGPKSMLAGLADGGVILEAVKDISTEDAAVLNALLADQLRKAKSLSEQIFRKGLSNAQARLKPRQWYGGVIQPFYDAGLLSAARNQMVEFVGTIDENSCDSCKALVGQRHRRRSFAAAGFNPPYGVSIICSDGNLCKHRLISVNGRPRGNLSRVPRK